MPKACDNNQRVFLTGALIRHMPLSRFEARDSGYDFGLGSCSASTQVPARRPRKGDANAGHSDGWSDGARSLRQRPETMKEPRRHAPERDDVASPVQGRAVRGFRRVFRVAVAAGSGGTAAGRASGARAIAGVHGKQGNWDAGTVPGRRPRDGRQISICVRSCGHRPGAAPASCCCRP